MKVSRFISQSLLNNTLSHYKRLILGSTIFILLMNNQSIIWGICVFDMIRRLFHIMLINFSQLWNVNHYSCCCAQNSNICLLAKKMCTQNWAQAVLQIFYFRRKKFNFAAAMCWNVECEWISVSSITENENKYCWYCLFHPFFVFISFCYF